MNELQVTAWVKYAAKAVYAAVTSFLTGWITALTDGGITQVEWLVIALGVITVTGGVFGLTNSAHPHSTSEDGA